MTRAFALSVVIAIIGMATSVTGGINESAKVAVHLVPYDCNRACSRNFPEFTDCSDINTTYCGCGNIDFFPVFFDLVEYRGLEYAVEWPGLCSCVFSTCSYCQIGEIVWPGDGISQVWLDCRQHGVAVPGWGWITVDVPGQVCVVPHPMTGNITIAGCELPAETDDLDFPTAAFCGGVCGARGQNPCGGPPEQATVATTWGSIKRVFK